MNVADQPAEPHRLLEQVFAGAPDLSGLHRLKVLKKFAFLNEKIEESRRSDNEFVRVQYKRRPAMIEEIAEF